MADKNTKNSPPEVAAVAAAEPKRGRLGVALVAVLLLSNAGLAAVLATGSLAVGGRGDGTGAEAENESDETVAVPTPELGPVLELEPFVLNLDEPGRARYLRIAMTLELDDELTLATLQSRMTVLRDRFISYLSSQQADSLRTPQDKDRLRAELVVISGTLVGTPETIRAIYFTEFLIQ